MTEQQQRLQLVTMARSLFERGYATGGAGNISVKLSDGRYLATPTGASLGRLTPESLALLDRDGRWLEGDKPSKEVAFHLALYAARPDYGAVVHLHSRHLTALSCLEGVNSHNVIRPFTPYYVMRVGRLPLIPYLRPGDPRIADELVSRAADNRAFLLANHGPVVTGCNLMDAVDNAEELEETARLLFLLKDHPVRYLSDDEVQQLQPRREPCPVSLPI